MNEKNWNIQTKNKPAKLSQPQNHIGGQQKKMIENFPYLT